MIFRQVPLTFNIPIIFVLLFCSAINSFGQLSQGGFPMEVSNLKSATLKDKVVIMSSFKLTHEDSIIEPNNLKTFKFAHSFPVSLTPQNSGTWYEIDGYRVWQVVIQSKGAYSLNTIFSKFSIPDRARLFVFDKEKNVILGAFTSKNNKPYKKLAIYPLPGDEMIVQYEEPKNADFEGELEIGEINHDYKGVFSLNNRWPRRPSEDCNVDVQCEFNSGFEKQRRSVCRIIASDELGTATLLNNVQQNGKPYAISAFHIYDNPETAKVTIYDFNYESPFCTGINGYDIQSLSGSTALASSDSLDLMLVELDEVPPPAYRPYYSGWDARHVKPFNSYTIHHPNGDTKKISHETGVCDSARYNDNFIKNGHWKVPYWDSGSTEGGSSGAGLFNNDKRLVGILSGGNASCTEKSYDLFARFDKQWNYRSEPEKQLKNWLDPGNTGTLKIDGYDPYLSTSNECNMVSNFVTDDVSVVLPEKSGNQGAYSGNNKMNISEIAEKFSGYKRAVLNGVSIGISHFKAITENPEITLRIYTGDTIPNFAIKQFKFSMSKLTTNAMNFLSFSESVEVEGNFFISIVIPEIDSLTIFQSAFRPVVLNNSLIIKQNDVWKPINRLTGDENSGASLLLEVMVCDASFPQSFDTTKSDDLIFNYFPNPASNYLVLEFKKRVPSYQFSMLDMTGRLVLSDVFENRMYSEINTSELQPGIYLIRVSDGELSETKRVVIN
jgi:lysyl endopeptidase